MIHIIDSDAIQPYLSDASNLSGGQAFSVLLPENYDEVRACVYECIEARQPITVSGRRTGLVGGAVPPTGVVVSTEKLSQILDISTSRRTLTTQSGVVLSDIQQSVSQLDLLYPPDPTEKTCSIGGTISTNASGARTFYYGSTRNYVEHLKVVLGDGELISLRRGEYITENNSLSLVSVDGRTYQLEIPHIPQRTDKSTSGYFLKNNMDAVDLFVGSEGTLGIIVEAELRLLPVPEQILAGVIFYSSLNECLRSVEEIRETSLMSRQNNVINSISARAIEFIDERALQSIRDQFPQIPESATAAVWFENEMTSENEQSILSAWYELSERTSSLARESWFGVNEADREKFRQFRHAVPSKVYERIKEKKQRKLGTDIAVPPKRFGEMMAYYNQILHDANIDYVAFGHIGNSHIHVNMFAESDAEFAKAQKIYGQYIDTALALGGTISAEHGIGKIKRKYFRQMFSEEEIFSMKKIKQVLDPYGVLGPETLF